MIFGVTSPTTTFDTTILRRGKDVALSIAGEIVVSDRLSRLFQTAEVSGFELRPVHKCDTNVPLADWYQLRVCRSAGREDPTDAVSARTEGLLMLKVFSEAG